MCYIILSPFLLTLIMSLLSSRTIAWHRICWLSAILLMKFALISHCTVQPGHLQGPISHCDEWLYERPDSNDCRQAYYELGLLGMFPEPLPSSGFTPGSISQRQGRPTTVEHLATPNSPRQVLAVLPLNFTVGMFFSHFQRNIRYNALRPV